MRNRHAFRPMVVGSLLEERVVPSSGGVTEQISDRYAVQFRQAFDGLTTTLSGAVGTTLMAGGGASASSRAAFDGTVRASVGALDANLTSMLALSPLAQYQLTPELGQLLVGSGPGSVVSQIGALPSPSGPGAPADAFVSEVRGIVSRALGTALADLDRFASPSNPLRVRAEAVAGTGGGSTTPQAAIRAQYDRVVQQAFGVLANNYTSSAGGLLGGTAAAQIATNRPAFDNQVQVGVTALAAELTSMLSLFPGVGARVGPAIQQRLVGGNGSLLGQLGALSSPTDLGGTSAQAFGQQAGTALASARSDILGIINGFGRSGTLADNSGLNAGLTGGSTTGSAGTALGPNFNGMLFSNFNNGFNSANFNNANLNGVFATPGFTNGTNNFGTFFSPGSSLGTSIAGNTFGNGLNFFGNNLVNNNGFLTNPNNGFLNGFNGSVGPSFNAGTTAFANNGSGVTFGSGPTTGFNLVNGANTLNTAFGSNFNNPFNGFGTVSGFASGNPFYNGLGGSLFNGTFNGFTSGSGNGFNNGTGLNGGLGYYQFGGLNSGFNNASGFNAGSGFTSGTGFNGGFSTTGLA